MSGFVNFPTIFSVNTFCCNHNNKKSLVSQSPTTRRQMFHQNEQRNESTPSLSSEWASETPSLPLWPPHHSRRSPLFALETAVSWLGVYWESESPPTGESLRMWPVSAGALFNGHTLHQTPTQTCAACQHGCRGVDGEQSDQSADIEPQRPSAVIWIDPIKLWALIQFKQVSYKIILHLCRCHEGEIIFRDQNRFCIRLLTRRF